MTKNIDQKEGSKFRTIENEGFGASKLKDLSVGDLIEWDSWGESLETEVFETKNGLLMDIIEEERLSGWAYIAKINVFGSGETLYMPLISIRKMQKRN